MAFRNETGQQLACKIIDLRVLKERFVREAEERHQSRSFAQVSATGEVVAVRRPRDPQEKLADIDREAQILEGLSHVGPGEQLKSYWADACLAKHHWN